MLLTAMLATLTLGTADPVPPPAWVGSVPVLHANHAPVVPMSVGLRSPLLEASARRPGEYRLAQRTRNATRTPAPAQAAPTPAPTPAPAPAPAAATPAQGATTTTTTTTTAEPAAAPAPASAPAAAETTPAPATAEAATPSAEEAQEAHDREVTQEATETALLRHRAHITRLHRPLGIATWSSLLVTILAGTVLAVNNRTAFGPGACAGTPTPPSTDACFLGSQAGVAFMTPFHTVSAFITLGFYATTGIFAMSMPDPERASEGTSIRAGRLRLHKTMAYIHLAGMILQPILGLIASRPDLIGLGFNPNAPNIADESARLQGFQSGMRTVHLGVGYVTFAALTTAMLLELL